MQLSQHPLQSPPEVHQPSIIIHMDLESNTPIEAGDNAFYHVETLILTTILGVCALAGIFSLSFVLSSNKGIVFQALYLVFLISALKMMWKMSWRIRHRPWRPEVEWGLADCIGGYIDDYLGGERNSEDGGIEQVFV